MRFKINEGLFKIDGFYYLIDPLRTWEIGKYHLTYDETANFTDEYKIDLLTDKGWLLAKNSDNVKYVGVVIASNKIILGTPYIELSPFEDIEEVEIETSGWGRMGDKAYLIDLSVDKYGNQKVILLNKKIKK